MPKLPPLNDAVAGPTNQILRPKWACGGRNAKHPSTCYKGQTYLYHTSDTPESRAIYALSMVLVIYHSWHNISSSKSHLMEKGLVNPMLHEFMVSTVRIDGLEKE